MALDLSQYPCVRQVLCGLSRATLQALIAYIDVQVAAARVAIAALQFQILKFDILTIPPQALKAVAEQGLALVEQGLNLVPFAAIQDCVPLGDFNIQLRADIDRATADVRTILDDITRLLSFKAELQAIVDELNALIDLYEALKVQIALCGA